MDRQPQVLFRNLEPSPAIEADIRRRAAWLSRFSSQLVGCRVVVEAPHHHHRHGNHYRVRIDLELPGAEITVDRNPLEHDAHADPYVAVRDAFRAARRQLLDHQQLVRGEVKEHPAIDIGQVARLFEEPGGCYGFLETNNRREIYFHENAVVNEWDELEIGDRVRYVEVSGDKGPQASTVERFERRRDTA